MMKLDPGGVNAGHQLQARIVVRIWSDSRLSIEGPLDSKSWCLAALDAARDALVNQNAGHALPPPPKRAADAPPLDPLRVSPPPAAPPGLTVAHQLVIGVWDDGGLSVEGPVTDRLWCLAALANAKDAVRAHRSDRALVVPGRDVEVPPPVHPLNLAASRA